MDNLDELVDKTHVRAYPTLLDMDEWENFTREHDIVISTRMHQTIIALNQGVPVLCYNGDMRAFEMLTFIWVSISNITSIQIISGEGPRGLPMDGTASMPECPKSNPSGTNSSPAITSPQSQIINWLCKMV